MENKPDKMGGGGNKQGMQRTKFNAWNFSPPQEPGDEYIAELVFVLENKNKRLWRAVLKI